jgi:hypothetical protein
MRRIVYLLLLATITVTSPVWAFDEPFVLDLNVKISEVNLTVDKDNKERLILSLPELAAKFNIDPNTMQFAADIPEYFPNAHQEILSAAIEQNGVLTAHVERQTTLVWVAGQAYVDEVIQVVIGDFVIIFERSERSEPIEPDNNDAQANLLLGPNEPSSRPLIGNWLSLARNNCGII